MHLGFSQVDGESMVSRLQVSLSPRDESIQNRLLACEGGPQVGF